VHREITSELPSYMNMPNSSGSLFLDSAPDSGSRHGRTFRRRRCHLSRHIDKSSYYRRRSIPYIS
jgi:hypothetical protein